MHGRVTTLLAWGSLLGLSQAACPYADSAQLGKRDEGEASDPLAKYKIDDSDGYMSTDAGGPMEDQASLKAGARGSTLLEDFIFRQKIQHFDHERVPERAVHARGVGAHGTFTSYADWSNLTAASFLNAPDKKTPMFVRFSTVAGSRGSADLARDVHGFATRFYTDEGNFDIVGNNIPVFFIQDAIQFPDLVHAVKPRPDNEIPQAATAHDSAWDFFSQQPSTLHTLFWAMAGHGIPRSLRHMDGFGVHTFRLVKEDGSSKLVKWHWKSRQGKASLVWEEAQIVAGKNADFHRQDLWDAIESGNGPEWELGVQVIDEDKVLAYGFDLLDPTKILPEELVPVTKLGVMKLDRNPTNYFAETEQVMFQPGHIVRGIDFTEDPLLQGRIFSYLDTQLNRNGGPNFEQLPINMPHSPIHNNNRDGAGQTFIHKNTAHYYPNTLNKGFPLQANQTVGRGFFTAPGRKVSGDLVRLISPTFDDHWSQPRLFYNSLSPVEQQFLINAIRFETSNVKSAEVKKNVIAQLNRVSHDVAVRVATALGLEAPAPDDTFYHNNVTAGVSTFAPNGTLPSIKTLRVGILASTQAKDSLAQAAQLKEALAADGLVVTIVGETLAEGVDQTYSAADATGFDGVVVAEGAEALFGADSKPSPLFPAGRPGQVLIDAYRWGKPVGALGSADKAFKSAGVPVDGEGVYGETTVDALVKGLEGGLARFRFTDRFALDE
ncbi:catalase-like domain-containing protein [Chaetomium tenue]|uniref:Catalase-like domain-containing protein n=1 Tax=Chaetomium tenue TaxID=1854479 RepID=A0ACB7PET0_9PEZI|nr:catalase-like domain-containing protein [Chaetomium globosum]